MNQNRNMKDWVADKQPRPKIAHRSMRLRRGFLLAQTFRNLGQTADGTWLIADPFDPFLRDRPISQLCTHQRANNRPTVSASPPQSSAVVKAER